MKKVLSLVLALIMVIGCVMAFSACGSNGDKDVDTKGNDTAKSTVDTLLDARDEVSGVQMDEEGINMLNYQKWYSASSRMLTTLDDALDKLINGTGRVGL